MSASFDSAASMILESIVVTTNLDGEANLAPMGPIVNNSGPTRFVLRPYRGSTTCENLLATGQATIHVTDDAGMFARAAIGKVSANGLIQRVPHTGETPWFRLKQCHRWFAVRITEITGGEPMHVMQTAIVAEGVQSPFFGFNRGKHAIIEASILATRVHLLDHQQIIDDLRRLRVAVQKTASAEDRQVFDWLCEQVHAKMHS